MVNREEIEDGSRDKYLDIEPAMNIARYESGDEPSMSIRLVLVEAVVASGGVELRVQELQLLVSLQQRGRKKYWHTAGEPTV